MDSVTIIMSLVMLGLVILPFAFTGRKYRKQKKQLVKALKGMAEKNQAKLSNYEICCNIGIGMDAESRFLFFARMIEDGIAVQSAALGEMTRCKMNSPGRITEEGEKVTELIQLVFHPVSTSQPSVEMVVYNIDVDSLTLKGELQVAMKWEQIANNAIKNLKKPDRNVSTSKRVAFA
jgi:hypothetical protein